MNITILEDTLEHQVRLESLLQKLGKEMKVPLRFRTTGKISEFEESLSGDRSHHLYFLDLDLHGEKEKGLEMAQLIRKNNPYALIVFVTTMSEYAPLTYRYHVSALDFIAKDGADYEEKVASCLEHAVSQLQIAEGKHPDLLQYVHRGRMELKIPYDDIFYIETTPISHKLLVQGRHCRNEFYGSLSELVKCDQEDHLTKVNRSAVVNFKNIREYDSRKGEIIFYDGTTYPLSSRYAKALRAYLKARQLEG